MKSVSQLWSVCKMSCKKDRLAWVAQWGSFSEYFLQIELVWNEKYLEALRG